MKLLKNIYITIHKLIKHITIQKVQGNGKFNINKTYDTNLFEIMLLPQQQINQLESFDSKYSIKINDNTINYTLKSSKSILYNIYENEGAINPDEYPLPYFYLAKARVNNNVAYVYETKQYQINNVSYISLYVDGHYYYAGSEFAGKASFDIYINGEYYGTSIREHPQHVVTGGIWGSLDIYLYTKENKNYTIEIKNIKFEGYCGSNTDTYFYVTGVYKTIKNKDIQQGTLVVFEKY